MPADLTDEGPEEAATAPKTKDTINESHGGQTGDLTKVKHVTAHMTRLVAALLSADTAHMIVLPGDQALHLHGRCHTAMACRLHLWTAHILPLYAP